MDTMPGRVALRQPQVVTRERDGELLLVHIPDDRYVVVDAAGRPLWEALAAGTSSMAELIAQHADRTGLPAEVAAFQVISFFDELRAQGYVTFELEGERRSAPLIDTELTEAERQIGVPASLRTDTANTRQMVRLVRPDPKLTLMDIRQLAERAGGTPLSNVGRAIVAATDKPDLSAADIDALLSDRGTDDVRRVAALSDPHAATTLGDLAGAGSSVAARVVVVVVVVVFGPIVIVVVVVGDGGGSSSGKSRSACKTMCV